MADYTVDIYLWSPYTYLPTSVNTTFTLNGDTSLTGSAVITDNETGVDGLTFDDNVSGSQETATATVTTPTRTYTDIDVNADAGWTLYDPVDNVYFEVVLFNGKSGGTSFTFTLSEYPLVQGRSYQVINFDNQPNAQVAGDPVFTYGDYVCFTGTSLIETSTGQKFAQTIRPGERVLTRDRGYQPVLWVGQRTVTGIGPSAPVELSACLTGTARSALVSPLHRVLIQSAETELLFGHAEVFAHAAHLTHLPGITRRPCAQVTYVHILTARHEALLADGLWMESLHPGKRLDVMLSRREIAQIDRALVPFGRTTTNYGPTVRMTLRHYEAALLRSFGAPARVPAESDA